MNEHRDNKAFIDYYRCPNRFAGFDLRGDVSLDEGYFRFGQAICYGRRCGGPPSKYIADSLPNVAHDVTCEGMRVRLPFSLSEVATNLRHERYRPNSHHSNGSTVPVALRTAYYLCRPILPIGVRRHLQRIHLKGWDNIAFPRWPVDFTIEALMQSAMMLMLRSCGIKEVPFIWFWPDGAQSCAIMTHDVESTTGRDFCEHLMDIDDSFDIKASFQLVPEGRYKIPAGFVENVRRNGFEVNVHDLNHDGRLFQTRKRFLHRAARINAYANEFGSRGFRSGAMYREQGWYDAFEFSYDMSVPNVAHLEPQQGGCCTVMPYFIGNLLELPLTTTQDYSLFHIIGDYSPALWKRQIELILSENGLMSFLTHPDYLTDKRARGVYEDLLTDLSRRRANGELWMALPGEVDAWWRRRSLMTLVPDGASWRVEGIGSDRARVAYASAGGERVIYRLDDERLKRR